MRVFVTISEASCFWLNIVDASFFFSLLSPFFLKWLVAFFLFPLLLAPDRGIEHC